MRYRSWAHGVGNTTGLEIWWLKARGDDVVDARSYGDAPVAELGGVGDTPFRGEPLCWPLWFHEIPRSDTDRLLDASAGLCT
jgi:hypothetical protein